MIRPLGLWGILALVLLVTPAAAQLDRLLDKAREAAGGSSGSGGGSGGSSSVAALGNTDIAAGLKDALKVGTERVVGRLGRANGFNNDPEVHIPLPASLRTAQKALRTAGLGDYGDDLELKLNRAAEVATPKAKALFWDSISAMTLDDAKRILDGPKDAATRYFQGKMSDPLKVEMRPVVDTTLGEVGAVQAYDRMMGQYAKLPFMPDAKANLTDYALDQALTGIFHYLAKEEAAIRDNPAKRTTELLQKVFSR